MDNKKDNIPLLRFQEFKGNWTEMKLSEVAEKIQDGTHFSPTVSKEGEFLYITAKNVKNGYIDLTNSQYISKEAHDKIYARCDVKTGDVLVTKDGTIGQVCVNTLEKPFSLLSSVAFVRPKKQTNNKFIYQLISSPLGQREISKSIAGQALKRITLTKLNQFKYYFPTLPEQQKIASFLTAVDKKIQQLTRKKELLEQYKKGVMQKLFSQELRFKDENGKDYPDWEVKRIAEVFEEITESVGKREIETYSISAGVGFVSQKEKFGKDISGQQNKKYNVVKPNQFSYNKGNSKTYKYGCIYLNNFEFPIAVPYVFISFKLIVSSMDTVFLQNFLNTII